MPGPKASSADFALSLKRSHCCVLAVAFVVMHRGGRHRAARCAGGPENRLQISPLGMSFLSRLARFEVSGNLILTR
jgi:hypothetical protein